MARSWGLFGRGLLLLAASWGASGLRQASGSDFGRIVEPFWEPKPMFVGSFFRHVAGASFSFSFACASALKFAFLHLAQKGHPSKFLIKTNILNEISMFAFLPGAPRGRHERLKKRSKTAFSRPRAKHPKKAPQKPRKSHPREAKMTPRSGPGGAGSDPRGPKTTPRAQSAPRAVGAAQRRSQSSLRTESD